MKINKYQHSFLIFVLEFLKQSPELIEPVISLLGDKVFFANSVSGFENNHEKIFISHLAYIISNHPELKDQILSIISTSNDHKQSVDEKIRENEWVDRQYALPIPQWVKRRCLLRNSIKDAIWVETGTAEGDMTVFLSTFAKKVFSIEAHAPFYERAYQRMKGIENIELLFGSSEQLFPNLIKNLSGEVCFFLDAHYSGPGTYRGPKDTSIIDELFLISKNLGVFSSALIAVDDLDCFYPPVGDDYPNLGFLINWAESNKLIWHIEQNIFFAKK